jgi:hypothetical protein
VIRHDRPCYVTGAHHENARPWRRARPFARGRPLPASPDERPRLDAYESEQARVTARMVKLPRCDLGNASLFDGDDTYAQLRLEVDPPEVLTQARGPERAPSAA